MPFGTPLTDEQRKMRHLVKYGTLENFPEQRKGEATYWKERAAGEIDRQIMELLISAQTDLGDVVAHDVYSSYIPWFRYTPEQERQKLESAKKKLELALALM